MSKAIALSRNSKDCKFHSEKTEFNHEWRIVEGIEKCIKCGIHSDSLSVVKVAI